MGATASVREPYEYSFSNELPDGEEEQNKNFLSLLIEEQGKPRQIKPTFLSCPCSKRHPFMQYRFGKKLGEGLSSVVYKGVAVADSKKVAIKEIPLSKLDREEFTDLKYEMHLLSQLDHVNIVKLISVYSPTAANSAADKLFQVLEYLKGGELINALCKRQEYDENDARRFIIQITSALRYLHTRGVIHRNIQPESLILENGSIHSSLKLVNFKYAVCESMMRKTSPDITPYTAPELINVNGTNLKYHSNVNSILSTKSDMYGLGGVMFLLLSGTQYSFDQSVKECLQRKEWANVSAAGKELVSRLLDRDPNNRYSADDVLRHNWCKQVSYANSPQNSMNSAESLPFHRLSMMSMGERMEEYNAGAAVGEEKEEIEYEIPGSENLVNNLHALREFNQMRKWCSSARVSSGVVNFQKSDRYMRERKVAVC